MISAKFRQRLNRLSAVLLATGMLLCGHAAQAQPVSEAVACSGASIHSVRASANAQNAGEYTRAFTHNHAGTGG